MGGNPVARTAAARPPDELLQAITTDGRTSRVKTDRRAHPEVRDSMYDATASAPDGPQTDQGN
nr:hypothetical protein OG781_15515 [Streptomyces sp. NBC_00830]